MFRTTNPSDRFVSTFFFFQVPSEMLVHSSIGIVLKQTQIARFFVQLSKQIESVSIQI